MREVKKTMHLRFHGLCYGANTSGLTVGNYSEFIHRRAYQLFEMRGCQSGHELDDWLQAEREMRLRC